MDKNQENDEQWLRDLTWLMDDARGRRVMWEILCRARVFHGSFSTNGSAVMFNEGRRDIGLWLMQELQSEEFGDKFLLMWKENVSIDTINRTAKT
jgi:hypothetical protein